jgi:H+-translocating diphosphatase
MTPVLYLLSEVCLPAEFTFTGIEGKVYRIYGFICCALGLWAGLIIGYVTEYVTSNSHRPV